MDSHDQRETNSSPPRPSRSTNKEDEARQHGADEPDGSSASHPHQRSLSENDLDGDKGSKHRFQPRNDGFDMLIVSRNFERCMENDEIDMGHYILAYRELERLFELMGSVFSFVGDDVKDKVGILEKHHQCPIHGLNYITVKSMMEFETAVPKERLEPGRPTNKIIIPSGSRTLLRLHRALDFIVLLMKGLIDANDDDPVSTIAQEAYKQSLSKYHGWIVRNAAHLAMYALPSKVGLMEKISKHSYSDIGEYARRMTASMDPVYKRTDELYTEYKLHELP